MSFLGEHIAKETGQPEPVAGPKSPHFDAAHHYNPEPPKNDGRVVMGADGREVNEHPELERMRAERVLPTDGGTPPAGVLTSGAHPWPAAEEESK